VFPQRNAAALLVQIGQPGPRALSPPNRDITVARFRDFFWGWGRMADGRGGAERNTRPRPTRLSWTPKMRQVAKVEPCP